jgi:hypothetical protein
LEEFYLKVGSGKPGQDAQPFFLFIREYVAAGGCSVRILYKAYLVPKGVDSEMKLIFLATAEDGRGEEQKVVVKFVQTYNARGHRVMAGAGYALEIYYCLMEDENREYIGELVMVVMEYVSDTQMVHE